MCETGLNREEGRGSLWILTTHNKAEAGAEQNAVMLLNEDKVSRQGHSWIETKAHDYTWVRCHRK